MSISDLDDAEARLNSLVNKEYSTTGDNISYSGNIQRALSIAPLPITRAIRLEVGLPLDDRFREVYENLIQTFITPMAETIAGRARVTLERGIRRIAAALVLATHTIESSFDSDPKDFEGLPVESQQVSFNLPMRRKRLASAPVATQGKQMASIESVVHDNASSSTRIDSNAFRVSSPPQPTPASSVTAPGSAQSLGKPAAPATPEAPYRRLQSLVNLSTQPALPSKLNETLQHWTLGADPSLYDWAATQDAFANQAEAEEQSEVSDLRKVKRRKRSSRNLENLSTPRSSLRGENEASSSQPTPAPAVRLTESQSTEFPTGSNQPTATQESGGQVMSQLVAGKHGNSRSKPKAPKKRKEGF